MPCVEGWVPVFDTSITSLAEVALKEFTETGKCFAFFVDTPRGLYPSILDTAISFRRLGCPPSLT